MMPVRMIQIQPSGGKGFWMSRTMKGDEKMTVAATRALEEEEGAAAVVLGDQVPTGVEDRGDEDEG